MACAGLKAIESSLYKPLAKNSTQRVIKLALKMLKYCNNVRNKNKDQKNIIVKIGIHYGPVIAGVIGYHKPQFSLIGDTVNTTSRICSTGENSTITISTSAFEQIREREPNLNLRERKVEAKGKGELITYQISLKNSRKKDTVHLLPQNNKEKFMGLKKLKTSEEFVEIAKQFRMDLKIRTYSKLNSIPKKDNLSQDKSPSPIIMSAALINKNDENLSYSKKDTFKKDCSINEKNNLSLVLSLRHMNSELNEKKSENIESKDSKKKTVRVFYSLFQVNNLKTFLKSFQKNSTRNARNFLENFLRTKINKMN